MIHKWERRDAKIKQKGKFASDNRSSVRLIAQLSLEPDKPKQRKNSKLR